MDKKTNFISSIKVACIFAGLIFGAGFASGREHMTFFVRFGQAGVYGIIIAGVVIALCAIAVMDICTRYKIKDYKGFMQVVFGKRAGAVLDIITGLFIFVMFSAMLAGAGALGTQLLEIPTSIGVFIVAGLCFGVLLFDLKGIVEINVIVTPILIIGALALGIYGILNANYQPVQYTTAQATMPFMALSYASYNMLTAIAVLSALPTLITNKKIARTGGLLGGAIIILIGIIFVMALLNNPGFVQTAQMPMLALASQASPIAYFGYTALLFLAIFTTAATNGFALLRWLLTRTRFTKMQLKILITTLGITTAHLGFGTMINYTYTAFGFLGILVVVKIIYKYIKRTTA